MSEPGYWERTSSEIIDKVVQAHARSSWKVLRAELIRHGHLFCGGASWPTKMYARAKRKVLDGTTWGVRTQSTPKTHDEAVARMLREFS